MVEVGTIIQRGIYKRKIVASISDRVYAKDDLGLVYKMDRSEIRKNWKEVKK